MTRVQTGFLRVSAFVRSAIVTVLVALVRGYQLFLSPMHGPTCRFHPSCSAYAIEALQRHGPLWGLLLTTWRLARCHPIGGFGHDPVPTERPSLSFILSRIIHGSHHAS